MLYGVKCGGLGENVVLWGKWWRLGVKSASGGKVLVSVREEGDIWSRKWYFGGKVEVFIREEGTLWGTGWHQPSPWRPSPWQPSPWQPQRLPSPPPPLPRILILSRKRPVAPNQWEEPVGKVGGPTGWEEPMRGGYHQWAEPARRVGGPTRWEEPRGRTPVMGGAIGWDPTNRRSQ